MSEEQDLESRLTAIETDLAAVKGRVVGRPFSINPFSANNPLSFRPLSVAAQHLKNLAVESAKIANLAVTTAKIDNLAVTNAKINDLDASKITAGLLTVDRLNVTGLFMQGFVWTDNSPSAGKIAWDAGTLQYDGVTYAISAGNSDTDTYVYWQKGTANTTFQHSATRPTLGDDDFLIATNTSGTHDLSFNAPATTAVFPAHLSFEAMASLFIYGDGIDGDVTISGDTTLTRDMSYDDLTIDSGFVLSPAGYRIFVKNTLTNNGTIRYNGSAATNQNGAAGAPAGNIGGGTAGGAGANGQFNQASVVGTGITNGLGAVGGTGGSVTSPGTDTENPGRAGGAVTTTRANRHGLMLLGDSAEIRGGTGGGGGGCSSGAGDLGGGGGGGGGIIIIAARTINNGSGTIEAKGGNGADGVNNIAGGCGGGGGGGGTIVLVYRSLTQGTLSVAGGTPGTTSGANTTPGTSGSTGLTLLIQQEA